MEMGGASPRPYKSKLPFVGADALIGPYKVR